MLQLRPTFSESWYRVKDLKVRLRPSAQISRQYYRGERWYVVRDPAGNQYHRLSDAAYRFVGLLDGSRTVGEAWDLVGGQLADDAPTQPEVIQILSQLHAANLVESNISPDAMVLLRRHKQQMKRKMQGRLLNFLFPRIPLWDPQRFLDRWMPVVRPFLSKWGALLWLIVTITGLSVLAPHWDEFWRETTTNALAPSNWLVLWLVFCGIKFIHELGHAFSCRRFGGEVHEMGIMFLVLIPTPYVDASSAWAFPSRWARMFVGAAGMIIELFVASLMVLVWVMTNPTEPLHHIAHNAIIIAGFTTIVFNANPLLRYDGYYMLSDWLEIPNLQQKSRDYFLGLIKRHVFRVKSTQPLPPVGQRVWLFVYAIASNVYRIFIGLMIIIMVTFQLPDQLKVLGLIMGMGAVTTWLIVPIWKSVKYLALEPELHRKRARASLASAAFAAVVLILVGLVPMWVRVKAVGVVEPDQIQDLYAGTPGFVETVEARDGQWLDEGQAILVTRNDDLAAQIITVEAELHAAEVEYRTAFAARDMNKAQGVQGQIDAIEAQLQNLYRQREELTVRAPFAGQLVAPQIDNYVGRYLERGAQVGTVAAMDRLVVRAVIDQKEAQLVPEEGVPDAQIRLAGKPNEVIIGRGGTRSASAFAELPSSALTHAAGGPYQAAPNDESGRRSIVPQFELRVEIDNANQIFYPGQRAHVLLKVDKKPAMWQAWRWLRQLVQDSNRMRQAQSQ